MTVRPLTMELLALRRALSTSGRNQQAEPSLPEPVVADPAPDLTFQTAQIRPIRADGALVVPDAVDGSCSPMAEFVELRAEISELQGRHKRLQGELAKMLITKQTSRDAVDRLDQQRAGLNDQVTGMLGELDQVRAEAKQLIADRRQLEVYVTALRQELAALQQKRGEIVGEIQVLESVREDLNSRPLPAPATHAAPAVKQPSPPPAPEAGAAAVPEQSVAKLAQALEVVAAHRQVDLEADSTHAEDLAFRQFFDTEIDHDKSRQWILG